MSLGGGGGSGDTNPARLRGQNRGLEGVNSRHYSGSRSVEIFIVDTVDALFAGGCQRFPFALDDDFLEWNAIAGAAPGSNHNIGIELTDGFCSGLFSCFPNKLSSGGLNQFRDPWLRMN